MYYIRLEFDCLRIGKNIGENWEEKSDKVDKIGFELVVIKNSAMKGWHR